MNADSAAERRTERRRNRRESVFMRSVLRAEVAELFQMIGVEIGDGVIAGNGGTEHGDVTVYPGDRAGAQLLMTGKDNALSGAGPAGGNDAGEAIDIDAVAIDFCRGAVGCDGVRQEKFAGGTPDHSRTGKAVSVADIVVQFPVQAVLGEFPVRMVFVQDDSRGRKIGFFRIARTGQKTDIGNVISPIEFVPPVVIRRPAVDDRKMIVGIRAVGGYPENQLLFLIDALRVIDDEEVDIYLINPKAPCFIKDKEESYIYLILPVNFNAVH